MWGFWGNSCRNLGVPSGVITACGWWVGLCKEDAKKSRHKAVPFLVFSEGDGTGVQLSTNKASQAPICPAAGLFGLVPQDNGR